MFNIRNTCLICSCIVNIFLFTRCTNKDTLTKKPVHVEVWNYYQGKQKIAFDNGVTEFNQTKGKKEGIIVTTVSIADPAELADVVIDACKKKVGARKPPAMVSLYPDEAFILYQLNALLPLDDFFTDEELDAFVPSFIQEGRICPSGELVIIPALKSTGILYYNKTDWNPFEAACGISPDDITSFEDLVNAAEKYYEWTDSLTPDIPYDGEAFFGLDSVGNYILSGLYQLGLEIDGSTIKNIRNAEYRFAFKKLWDHYYIPFVKGRFLGKASYRSTDMRMGRILCSLSSSAAVNYFSLNIIKENDESYDIEMGVKAPPLFIGSLNKSAVQQGAGFSIVKNTREVDAASVTFLKWVTDRNVLSNIAVKAGYVPPLKSVITNAAVDELLTKNDFHTFYRKSCAKMTAELLQLEHKFIPKPFRHSLRVRNMFEHDLSDRAKKDRAVVEERLKKGMSFNAAVEEFISEDYFNRWYEQLCNSIFDLMNYE